VDADLDIEVPKKPGNGKRFKQVPVRYLLPNLMTLLALCSGVTAIRLGIEGRYELAVGAVIISIVLDALDGRLARFLKAPRALAQNSIHWRTLSILVWPRQS
jgi:hypothetical protein